MAIRTPERTRRRTPLSRERVLDAAIALADEGGFESLTMRKLAKELGVEAMSLYNHVANKDDLLDGMVDAVIGEIDPPVPGAGWKTAIRQRVLSARRVLLRHPWASRVIETRTNRTPVVLGYMDSMTGMFLAGGFSADLGHKLGTSSFTMGMLDEGAGNYDALALGDREEELGTNISAGAGLDDAGVNLSALKEKLDPSLALYADVIERPTFDPKEIDRVRKTWIAGIAQEKAEPNALALRLLPPLMYGAGHPYAIPLSGTGTEESIASLTRDDLLAFYKQWLRPDNATLIVVGDTTLAELVPLLEKHFADWKAPAEPLPVIEIKPAALPAKPRVFLVNQPGALQATILAGQVVRSSVGLDAWNFYLADDVIGGQFSARLNMNLREDKHWAYGAYSFAQQSIGQEPWIAFAPVQIDKTAESVVEMHREIADFVSGKAPITEAELAKVKANQVRSLPGGYETGGAVMGQISGMITYQRPDDYVQRKQQIINGVSLDAARAAAGDIHADSLTWIVVGDLSKIETGIRALNLGEVQVIDDNGKPVPVK